MNILTFVSTIQACIQVCPKNPANFNVDNVRVAKLLGGGLHNSAVVPGMVLRNDAVGTIKHIEKAKVRSLYILSYWKGYLLCNSFVGILHNSVIFISFMLFLKPNGHQVIMKNIYLFSLTYC